MGGWEEGNQYTVYDKNAKVKLFKAKEKTGCLWRNWCGEHRPLRIKVSDHLGEEDKNVLLLTRRYRCCGCAAIPCCAHKLNIHYMIDSEGNELDHTSSDTLISTAQVPWCGGCCWPTINIYDRAYTKQATVTGPFCCVSELCGSDFNVTDKEGQNIGQIQKLKADTLKRLAVQLSTDSDNFQITFPKELELGVKLALLATLFQIDFTFFEDDRTPATGRCCDLYCCGWACPCLPREVTAWFRSCYKCNPLPCHFPCCCCGCCLNEVGSDADLKHHKRGGAPQDTVMER